METTACIHYLPTQTAGGTEVERLARAAAVEPILKRWRLKCSPGLIDENGKIRNVFTRTRRDGADNVSRVIDELNHEPAAVAEFAEALEASLQLQAAQRNAVEMPIHDARQLNDASLHGCGFQLEQHRSQVSNWRDEQELARIYYEEIAALVKQVTGAEHAFSSQHLYRQSEPQRGGDGPLAKLLAQSRGPVHAAHNDFTERYGDAILKTIEAGGVPHTQTFGITDAMIAAGIEPADVRGRRILLVNTWRSVGPVPLKVEPLALADRRSVSRACLRSNLIGKVPIGQPRGGIEVYGARHEPTHRWYYYPDMTVDEVLLWKGYDSAEVPAQPTLHTAFTADAPMDAPQRQSVEVRVLCVMPMN